VGVAADAVLQAVQAVARGREHEHPAAPQLEVALAAPVEEQRVEDPEAKRDQRQADDPLHDRVDPLGQQGLEVQRQRAEGRDDCRVAERVERGQPDRPRLQRAEAGPPGTNRRIG
jgi:hypothetical protein